jgi:division protein CdvB (Snf7/Vps24/ESCRT-III family)
MGKTVADGRGLREMVQDSINMLTNVSRQIDVKEAALIEKDKRIFSEIVRAKQNGQDARASMLANELSQLRRTRNNIVGSKIAIEAIVQRLETAKEAGDFALTLGPAVAVAAALKKQLAATMPEALRNLNESFQDLNSVITESGQLSGHIPDIQLAGEEAEKIISEAQLAAELQAKERFPDVPTEVKQLEQEEA